MDGQVAGFISVTPPGRGNCSIDKYFARAALPFAFDATLYEIRLLTVLKAHRGRELATLLMYAALRWVESHGGTHLVAIGRREVVELYLRVGLRAVGLATQSGAVTYDLLHATLDEMRPPLAALDEFIGRVQERTDWQLPFAFRTPAACFHGGAFSSAIGKNFDHLERKRDRLQIPVQGLRAQRRARRVSLRRPAPTRIAARHHATVGRRPAHPVAAVRALQDPGYYAARYAETATARE